MWDAVTSRKFRDKPFKTVGRVIVPEDPMMVLRADPPRTGDEQAKAMHRLKEPLRNKGTKEDQDQIVELLARTATADSSPVLRYAAIEALGRFEDPRVFAILMLAYQKADGEPDAKLQPPKPLDIKIELAGGGRSAGRLPTRIGEDPSSLRAPSGYAADTVAALRCRCLESLGNTRTPEAAKFLAAVVGAGGADIAPPGSNDEEIRHAAVRALAQSRQPEAVVALAHVLNTEVAKVGTDKDPTLIHTAHQGLVRLTGKNLPPDPQQWNQVVQAGVTITREPSWVEDTVQNAVYWVKKK